MSNKSFPFLELNDPVKGKIAIPYRQYKLNEQQQFAVIAIDFMLQHIELGDHKGITYDRMGKLSEQNFIFKQQIINSLEIDQWDFSEFPDPEIVLITEGTV